MVEVTPYLSGVVGGVMRSGNMEMTIYLLENLEEGKTEPADDVREPTETTTSDVEQRS